MTTTKKEFDVEAAKPLLQAIATIADADEDLYERAVIIKGLYGQGAVPGGTMLDRDKAEKLLNWARIIRLSPNGWIAMRRWSTNARPPLAPAFADARPPRVWLDYIPICRAASTSHKRPRNACCPTTPRPCCAKPLG